MNEASTTPGDRGAMATALPQQFVERLKDHFGEQVSAVVMYGSWLRGKRDTVLDFYVLLDDYAAMDSRIQAYGNRLLAPNVYHIGCEYDGVRFTAKYATLTLEHLERAVREHFHSYFWARFAQPVEVIFARDAAITARISNACSQAAGRMINETLPLMAGEFSTSDLWTRALSLTYASELRSEDPSRAGELADIYAQHFELITDTLAQACGLTEIAPGTWRHHPDRPAEHQARRRWWRRRTLGKLLSILRLFKAAFTFNDPLDYVLWKVERHTGVKESASDRQRRHPLLFAWPVLWRIYRRGGFR